MNTKTKVILSFVAFTGIMLMPVKLNVFNYTNVNVFDVDGSPIEGTKLVQLCEYSLYNGDKYIKNGSSGITVGLII